MKNIFILICIAVIFVSCEETVKLDLDQTQPTIVIEGLVTNRAGLQGVKVTKTADFYNTGSTPRITNALVSVKDDLGVEHIFVHNPRNVADSTGIYIPQDGFVGEIGRIYTLTVEAEGKTYQASDELFSVIEIDSMKYRLSDTTPDGEAFDPKEENKIYETLLFAKEPQDETNFYLFKFYRNDSLKYYDETDIYYSDDKLLAENIDGLASPVYYGLGDKAGVEGYSLTRAGYLFYNDLFSILNNDAGGMFGPIPASPRTNLSNGALGFFQVSAVNSISIVVE
jgi:hypothetical protein